MENLESCLKPFSSMGKCLEKKCCAVEQDSIIISELPRGETH